MTKVVVVDDDQDLAYVIGVALEREGYKVCVCNSGVEAMSVIDRERPDLLILDILMPGMDGWEVCRRTRENEFLRDTKIVILTTEDYLEEGEDYQSCMAEFYIRKPVRLDSILETVKQALD